MAEAPGAGAGMADRGSASRVDGQAVSSKRNELIPFLLGGMGRKQICHSTVNFLLRQSSLGR